MLGAWSWGWSGYDPKTECVAFEKDVPRKLLPMARGIAGVPRTETDAIYEFELTPMKAGDLGGFLGTMIDVDRLLFFFEAFDLDFQKRA
jgi:hypothetical protein